MQAALSSLEQQTRSQTKKSAHSSPPVTVIYDEKPSLSVDLATDNLVQTIRAAPQVS